VADILIPIQTPWDMLFSLLTDNHFLAAYVLVLFLLAFFLRRMRLGMIGNIGAAVRRSSVRSLKRNKSGAFPVAILAVFAAYFVFDLVSGYLVDKFLDHDNVKYIEGLSGSEFFGLLWESGVWLIVVLMAVWAVFCIWFAFPGKKAINRVV